MTRSYAQYTRQEKTEAVAEASVTSIEAAAKKRGIPQTTLGYWMRHPQFAELRDKTRDQVAEQFWATIQLGLEAVATDLADGRAPLRDKATALGILYDKYALLTGAATARTESRDLTGTLPDADLIAALREADKITGGDGTPPAPESAAA
jgi:hypothetical protein